MRSLCRLIETTGKEAPLLVIASEGGLAALSADWGFDDLLLATAGPAEVDVQLRLAMSPSAASAADPLIQTRKHRDRRGRLLGQIERRPVGPDLHRIRTAEVPRPASRPGFSAASSCSATSGVTTTTAAPARSTSMYDDFGPNSVRSTSR